MAILVSERLNFKVRTDLEITTEVFEHCIVKVKLRNEKLMCCSGYRAPNTDTSTFHLEYENILNNMKCDVSMVISYTQIRWYNGAVFSHGSV